jgi:uncharacterized protein (TIGR02145 family)
MKKCVLLFVFILLVIPVYFNCCEKDEKEDILPPDCDIIAPADSSEFQIGDTITINVEATDTDGLINAVLFYIDNVGKYSTKVLPYQFKWPTLNETAGFHNIRVSALDRGGNSSSDECVINLVIKPPVVITASVSSITSNSAVSGGNVTNSGGAAVTARGVCWSTLPDPTLDNAKGYTEDGSGTGSFTSYLNGLERVTTYFVRAYATNSKGTSYGEQVKFTTEYTSLVVTTSPVTSVTNISAICGGEITDDGGLSVIARGVCWNTTGEPTLSDNYTVNGQGTGSFTSTLTNLELNTTYYVRAYATNSKGTKYGNTISFTTNAGLPKVITEEASLITCNSVQTGASIIDDGGMPVFLRGICWSTTANPTINDSKTKNGFGTGSFTANISGLIHTTIYYVRAYAINSIGIAYGNTITFTTAPADLPIVETIPVYNITATTASGGGEIKSNGCSSISARGVCWSTSPNPMIYDNKTNDGSETGSFTSTLINLEPNTTYYVRAYAINSIGTAYGQEISFTTFSEGDIVTDYDGNKYLTVKIGKQTWMTENLKTTHYADGTPLIDGTGLQGIKGDYTTKYYFDYNDDPVNTATYGKLYTWAAAMNGASSSDANPSGVQGVCPSGWHMPSYSEWLQLSDYLGGNIVAGGKMKETGTAHWNSPNEAATNESGFTGLPAGARSYIGTYIHMGIAGSFWSSTESNSVSASCPFLKNEYQSFMIGNVHCKDTGSSVRCVHD